ncbi:MAG: Asp23/Gls24 family envelope stress response protein [Anaerobacillus sp.]
MKKHLNQGTLSISESVIEFILEVAVKETEGVELIKAPVKQTLKKMVGRGRKSAYHYEGVEDCGLSLRVEVAISFGEVIPFICFMLQERIKQDIEKMTGLYVDEINIVVAGLRLQGDLPEE